MNPLIVIELTKVRSTTFGTSCVGSSRSRSSESLLISYRLPAFLADSDFGLLIAALPFLLSIGKSKIRRFSTHACVARRSKDSSKDFLILREGSLAVTMVNPFIKTNWCKFEISISFLVKEISTHGLEPCRFFAATQCPRKQEGSWSSVRTASLI